MKVVIAGSRSISQYELIDLAIRAAKYEITEIISGGAIGIDRLAKRYALENGIPYREFLPNYKFGKYGPLRRNTEMAEYGDALIAIWDGSSRGTAHMISQMGSKPIFCYRTDNIIL